MIVSKNRLTIKKSIKLYSRTKKKYSPIDESSEKFAISMYKKKKTKMKIIYNIS